MTRRANYRHIMVDGRPAEGAAVTTTPTGTTATINWGSGKTQILDLGSATGNVTITFVAPPAGADDLTLYIIQGAVARSVVWPATCKWPSAVAPTLSAANDEVDRFHFKYVAATTFFYGDWSNDYS